MSRISLSLSLLSMVLAGLLLYCGLKLADAYSRIEAGVIGEMWLQHQRDFLIKLPTLMRKAGNKEALLKLLDKEYPDTAAMEYKGGIVFPPLLLEFDPTGSQVVDIRELTKDDAQALAITIDASGGEAATNNGTSK